MFYICRYCVFTWYNRETETVRAKGRDGERRRRQEKRKRERNSDKWRQGNEDGVEVRVVYPNEFLTVKQLHKLSKSNGKLPKHVTRSSTLSNYVSPGPK